MTLTARHLVSNLALSDANFDAKAVSEDLVLATLYDAARQERVGLTKPVITWVDPAFLRRRECHVEADLLERMGGVYVTATANTVVSQVVAVDRNRPRRDVEGPAVTRKSLSN